jgi:hypothetical protein
MIKDAMLRDRMGQEADIICLEMEAWALDENMPHYPRSFPTVTPV